MKKLYNVPRNSRICIRHLNLETEDGTALTELNFKSVDGMYSISTTDEGQYIHLSATTEVKVL